MMFTFESPDTEDGKARQHRFMIELTRYALNKFENNKTKTAEFLGVSVRTLQERVKKHDELTEYYIEPKMDELCMTTHYNLIKDWGKRPWLK